MRRQLLLPRKEVQDFKGDLEMVFKTGLAARRLNRFGNFVQEPKTECAFVRA